MPDHTRGQFPSLDGDAATEVRQRTEVATDGDWFRKVFTVHNRAWTRDLPADHWGHHPNLGATLQAALQQGLHPKGMPELESEADHPTDPTRSTDLTYRVRVVPAVADEEPGNTLTPAILQQVLADGGGVVVDDPDAPPVKPEK